MPDAHPRTRRIAWPAVAAVVVVAAIGTGIGLWATGASAVGGYRLGTATTASVSKTLQLTGTASPVHQATAEFQVAGTVSAVSASLNEQVTAGETLASLKTTALEKDVSSAQTTLTSAESKLSEDESAQSSTTDSSTSTTSPSATGSANTGTSSPTTTSTTTPATSSPSGSGGTSSATAKLAKAQQAVVTAQQSADSDTAVAQAALTSAQSVCSEPSAPTGSSTQGSAARPSATPSATTSSGTSSTTTSPSGTTPSSSSTSAACASALAKALAAQQLVQEDQKTVAQAETDLAKLLNSSSSSAPDQGTSTGTASSTSSASPSSGSSNATPGSGSTDAPTGTPTDTGSSATPTTTSSSAPTGSSSTTHSSTSLGGTSTASDSAQQLASDQASIDTARASLITAQQHLADAQLTSPISGIVAAVNLTVGQSVSAGSSSDAITVVNSGSYEATATLTPTQANTVKVGDAAQVAVTGTSGSITGTVARVGPVDTSSSSYTYPLVVVLPAGSHGITAGSSAQITVTLDQVKDAKVVPTSAVHTANGITYVETVKTGQEDRKPVGIGVVGVEYTQITSGLSSTTKVVLANLTEAVPSSSSTKTSSASAFSGSFPGGGGGTIQIRRFAAQGG